MPERKFLRLLQRRGVSNSDKKLKPHVPSRHQVIDDGLTDPHAHFTFAQGTLFPSYVNAGDIAFIERYVQQQWDSFRHNKPSSVMMCHEAGGAQRISVKMERYGIRSVGAFIRFGQVATVFPEEANGGSFLLVNHKRTKKSGR